MLVCNELAIATWMHTPLIFVFSLCCRCCCCLFFFCSIQSDISEALSINHWSMGIITSHSLCLWHIKSTLQISNSSSDSSRSAHHHTQTSTIVVDFNDIASLIVNGPVVTNRNELNATWTLSNSILFDSLQQHNSECNGLGDDESEWHRVTQSNTEWRV